MAKAKRTTSQSHSALNIVRKYHPNVTKVVDAKQKVLIKVTKHDCDSATKKAPGDCAMAKAFKREYDGAIISMARAYLVKGNVATRYAVPQAVQREIVSFDRHADFAPGEYTLGPVLGETNKLGNRDLRKRTKYYRKRPAVRGKAHRTVGIRAL
jgi:hypothetical protein